MSKTETPDIVERLQTAIDDRGKGSVWGYAGLLEDAAAEIERLRSELAKHQWRTMESAPRNEYVLVYCPDAAEYTRIMICGLLEFENDPDPPEWYELNADTRPDPLDVEPTHWQPLPSPPGENDG